MLRRNNIDRYDVSVIIRTNLIYLNNESVEKTVEKSSVKSSVKNSERIIDLLIKNHDVSALELAQKVGSRLVQKVGSRLVENQLKILLLVEENPKISKRRMC